MNYIREIFEDSPLIPAVNNDEMLDKSIEMQCKVVFVLYGNICNIGDIVGRLKENGKVVIVHIDLIEGMNSRPIAVDFIKKYTEADGVITTKPNLMVRAKELKLIAIQRFFLIDSLAYKNVMRNLVANKPDVIEILPGVISKTMEKLQKNTHIPIIAGGLITDKKDIMLALSSGAISVSTTNPELWDL